MSDDIVARLRVWGGGFSGNNPDCESDCDEAANEIERLRAEIERLRITDEEQTALVSAIGYHVFDGQVETLERMLDRINVVLDVPQEGE